MRKAARWAVLIAIGAFLSLMSYETLEPQPMPTIQTDP